MHVGKQRHHGNRITGVGDAPNLIGCNLLGHVLRVADDTHARRTNGVQAHIETGIAQHARIEVGQSTAQAVAHAVNSIWSLCTTLRYKVHQLALIAFEGFQETTVKHIAPWTDAITDVCVGSEIEFVVLEIRAARDQHQLVTATARAVCDETETAEEVDVEKTGSAGECTKSI